MYVHSLLRRTLSDSYAVWVHKMVKLLENDSYDIRRKYLQRNLVAVSRVSGGMLPDSDISGNVIQTEVYHCGSKMYDIWTGYYMEEEKCALKVLRTIETDKSIRLVCHSELI